MKKMIMTALAAVLYASASLAGSFSITGNNKDTQVTSVGTAANASGVSARVGNTTGFGTNTSYVIPFLLPALPAGSTVGDVSLTVEVLGAAAYAANEIHMDILGGRTNASATVLASDWNYGFLLAGDVANLYKTNPITAGSHTYTLDSTYFQNAYSNGAAGSFVFITLMADGANIATLNNYATIATANSTSNTYWPTLTITTIDDPSVKLIETSVNSLNITEGATNSFNIRLNNQPASDVTVNVSRVSGDANIVMVPDPTALVFSAANWDVWQPVYVAALTDADTSNAVATIECTDAGGGYTSASVSATQTDATLAASFTAAPATGFAPLAVTFTDTSAGVITGRFWDFGDGETTNTLLTTVLHTYTAAGSNCTVQLTVNGPLGSSTTNKPDFIRILPGAPPVLPVYDAFNDSVSNSAVPAGWFCLNPGTGTAHSRIDAGSLSYAGLQTSAGNSFGLGNKTDDYTMLFTSPNLNTNETIYFSTLLRFNNTMPSNMVSGALRLSDGADPYGSGVEVGFGVTNGESTVGFCLDNRNRIWNDVGPVRTPSVYTAVDVTYLIVGAYTRGTNASSGSVRLWINPDSATFGTATPPAATLTMDSYASDANWNRLDIISAGSGSWPASWQMDEVRIATSWGGVVPASGGAFYTLTASAAGNGTVSPTNASVASGGSAGFTVTASNYYRIASLTTNGAAVAGMLFDNNSTVTNFTWSNVQADGALVVTFAKQTANDPAGTPYEWLAGYGLTNFDSDAAADQDMDGLQAWQEYIAGTVPTNAASGLKAVQNTRDVISWDAVAGRVYSVYWSTNLASGFQALNTGIVYPQSSYTNTQPDARANYYQLKVQQE